MVFGIENVEARYFTYFYEVNGFYFAINVNSDFPFNSPARHPGSIVYSADYGKSLKDWAKVIVPHELKDREFIKVKNEPGKFYPRIWRGNMANLDEVMLAGSQSILSKAVVAVELLTQRLFEIFTYVEPTLENQKCFGHKIRELLLLSCMEVESGWTAILRANESQSRWLSTRDYIKLCTPLYLQDYKVEFPMYPEIGIVKPFRGWNEKAPTESIPWFSAYNSSKHNREDHFKQATLEHAISSVAASAILLCAQFGPETIPDGVEVFLPRVSVDWPYIPLGNGNRSTNSDGSTQGIAYNTFSTWDVETFSF